MSPLPQRPQPRPLSASTRGLVFALLMGAGLALAACTAGPNPVLGAAGASGAVAGFWLGLWHGIIAPIAFVISLFYDSVTLYEVHNNGGWYDFGFVLGAGILFGGGGRAARRRR